jgi:hypothetical protein
VFIEAYAEWGNYDIPLVKNGYQHMLMCFSEVACKHKPDYSMVSRVQYTLFTQTALLQHFSAFQPPPER